MDYIVVEINGVRHKLVPDDISKDACAACSLNSICSSEDSMCSAFVGLYHDSIHSHFEIE